MMVTSTIPETLKGLWKLPSGWDWIALDEVCSRIDGGGTPKRSHPEYFDGGHIVWVTPTDLEVNNPIQEITDSQNKITQLGYESSSAKMMPVGAVLFSSRASIGKIGVARVPLCTNQGFANFVCSDAIDNHYLAWCLRALTSEITKLAGSTTYREISRSNLRRFRVPIPFPGAPEKSLDIQRRIVARVEILLHELQESRKVCDQIKKDANRLLEVAINEVFTKFQVIIEVVPFQDTVMAFNGRASGSGISNVRVFKTKHVYPHKLRLDKLSYAKPEQAPKLPEEKFLRPGDVLMANMAEGTLGRVTYVYECEENWTVDTQVMILRPKDENEVLGKWLYYYFWSERGQREILSRRSGIAFADKRGQTHIYPRDMQLIPFPKMPINAQRQAVAYLDTVLNESGKMTELIQQDIKTLDLLEQSILDRAFRGEL